MTFRPTPRDRWIYPVVIFVANIGIYLALKSLTEPALVVALLIALMMFIAFMIWAIFTSIQVWRSRVVVDQIGVHWQGGPLKMGSLDWAHIKAVSYDERYSTMTPGSLEDVAGRRHPLPFLHDELVREIEEHLGRSTRT